MYEKNYYINCIVACSCICLHGAVFKRTDSERIGRSNREEKRAREERERTIAQLKQRLANEYDNAQRYTICSELFTQYLHYQADSALHYVDEMERYVGSAKPQRAEADVIINRADAMGVMGAYNEALQTLEQIDRNLVTPDVRLKYYYAMRTLLRLDGGLHHYPFGKGKNTSADRLLP